MLIWFRRDLRVAGNPALAEAVAAARRMGETVVPMFVLDPQLLDSAGPNRVAFLLRSIEAFRTAGVPLVVRRGDPVSEIPRLAAETASSAVFAARDFGPYGRRRDRQVADGLAADGRRMELVGSPYVVEPGTVRTKTGASFQVFTPFHRVWLDHVEQAEPPEHVEPASVEWHSGCRSDPLPREPDGVARALPDVGEAAAWARWEAFRAGHLDDYAEARDRPGRDGTSRLSVDLKFGAMHPRQLLPALRGAAPGSGAWVFRSELAWREFYAEVLWRRPETAWRNYAPAMDAMRTDRGPLADERFEAWTQGRTGFPFIDAGMRQLLAEGWMHNRVRMAVASFLVKDLHLDWQRGAAWFMRHLVDGDLASNQHGWQWAAGTGTDAAPYFRIFNPTNQGRTHDPDGTYIRRYVPELADFTGNVHEPRRFTTGSGRAAARGNGDQLSVFESPEPGYPAPIVDHSAERADALARLAESRRGTPTIERRTGA